MKRCTSLILIVSCALAASAMAASNTARFQVQLSLVATCSIDKIGRTQSGSLATDVACSRGSSYDVGLSHSHGTRTVKSANGSTEDFQYFPDSAHSLDWDNASLLSATGTGAVMTHTVDSNANNKDSAQPSSGNWTTLTLTF